MIARYAGSSRCSRSPTSPTLRIAVSGVRSSCETSAVNRRICSNDASSRPSVSLNTVASRPISSSGLCDRQPIAQALGGDRPGALGHPLDRRQRAPRQRVAAEAGRSRRRAAGRARGSAARSLQLLRASAPRDARDLDDHRHGVGILRTNRPAAAEHADRRGVGRHRRRSCCRPEREAGGFPAAADCAASELWKSSCAVRGSRPAARADPRRRTLPARAR